MTDRKIQAIGLAVSIVSAVGAFITPILDDKKMDAKIEEKVAIAVAEAINNLKKES